MELNTENNNDKNNENNDNVKVIIKYSSYTEAQKRAIYKYRSKNKVKIAELHLKYFREKIKDPEYMEKQRERSKKYYLKCKNKKLEEKTLKNTLEN